jgi:two-component system response regulator RegA
MVVDDDRAVLSLTARWLVDAGYEATTASTFEDAAQALEAHRPDVLIIDVRLGEFNGLQLAFRARELYPDVRIVMVSGWDDPVLRADALGCGASYLCKPLSPRSLLEAISAAEPSAPPRTV